MAQAFGRYELLELLGRGGMGEVYRARDTERRRDVALKVLPVHLATDEKFMARFRRESQLAAQLSDPHIIPIHDFGEIDGRLYIDMRLVAGADLGSVLEERGRLSPAVAVDILTQVASALDSAHADGLVHRDVKPSNVMLTGLSPDLARRPPFAYLVDFGIARSTQQMTALTATSEAIGTAAYMSPERISGEVGDGRGDVYALACLLYETITGQPPFQGELVSLIFQHLNADPPRTADVVAEVPSALDGVIARGMAKAPADRFDTAGDLAMAARDALSPPLAGGPPAVRRPTPQAGPSRRPRPTAATPRATAAPSEPVGETRAGPASWPEPTRGPVVTSNAAGQPLPAGTVTLLFADVEGSTRLLHAGGERSGEVLPELRRVLREVWARHGGVEAGTRAGTGAALVAFADAPSAVGAAADAQRTLARQRPGGAEVRVRMGVHSGRPRQRDGGYWGPDTHYVARLASAAHGGQVLVSDTTQALVGPVALHSLGRHALADFPTARTIHHLVVDGSSAADFPRPRTVGVARANLPTPSGELIGRGAEVDALTRRITGGARLVTLVAPDGTGKTRLSVEVGHRLAPRFESVWFVGLDPVTEPEDVLPALARTIGLPELAGADLLERLAENLRGRRVLVVLDSVEHVSEAAPAVAELVAAADGLHVLATGRAPLHVGDEQVVHLDALAVPAGDRADIAAVPAVRLLLDRARAAGRIVAVDPATSADLADLSRRLEGLPLAIELAAARPAVLDPAALCRRLDAGVDALDPGTRELADRRQGLQAVLEWSVGLLEPAQRRLLILLSAFASGFSWAVALAAFGDAIDDLAPLLDAGLVHPADDGRFVVRPPVRRFVEELAGASGDPHVGRRAVARALAAAAEVHEPLWMLSEGAGRLLLQPEQANILAALDWARDHDPDLHVRLAASTAWLLHRSGLAESCRAQLAVALPRAGDPALRARCVQALGVLGQGEADAATSEQAADLWHERGVADREVMCLAWASNLHGRLRRAGPALALVERAAALAPGTSDPAGVDWLLGLLRAQGLAVSGRHDEAAGAAGAAVTAMTSGDPFGRFWATTIPADVALLAGRAADALALYGAAIQVLEPFETRSVELVQADTVVVALVELERFDDAAAVLAICEAVRAELAWPPDPGFAGHRDRIRDRIRERVAPERLIAARERAASYSMSEALAWVSRLARGEAEPRGRARTRG